MTEKRFTLHIKWFNYEKTEGEAELKDNGQPILLTECIEDVRNLKDLLNQLNDENTRLLKANMKLTEENTNILNLIRTTYNNERTSIGRNTLKQLIEALE